MNQISSKALLGTNVFSITEGEAIGVVKNIILDPTTKQLLALAVDRRGWYKDIRIIAGNKIKNLGTDAVTIEEKANAERAANLPKMVKYMHQPVNLIGNRVVSDDGHTLGKVEEYYLNRDTGKICRLEVSGGVLGNILSGKVAISGEYILTIGISAVMVDKNCLNHLEEIESRLQQNLQAAKERTGQAWQATLSTSKKWGQNLTDKISQYQVEKAEQKAKKGEEDFENSLSPKLDENACPIQHKLQSKIKAEIQSMIAENPKPKLDETIQANPNENNENNINQNIDNNLNEQLNPKTTESNNPPTPPPTALNQENQPEIQAETSQNQEKQAANPKIILPPLPIE